MKHKHKTQSKITKPAGVSAMQWITALLDANAPDPTAQKHYEPVGDRRRRMEANKADPTRRQEHNAKKAMARVKKYCKPTLAQRRFINDYRYFYNTSYDKVAIADFQRIANDDYLRSIPPDAGRRRRKTLIRKAKQQLGAQL